MNSARSRAWIAAASATLSAAIASCVGVAWAGSAGLSRMLPWIVGRGLGIAGYLSLFALTVLGLWLRHPWRARLGRPSPEVVLRVHAVLAPLTLVLIVGHVVALALDSYAHVGWTGAIIPGASTFRPLAVALGTLSLYFGVLVGVTAALAGRWRRLRWLPIHRLASFAFAAVWLHGVLSGSDTKVMLPIYLVTGLVTLAVWLSRRLARRATDEPRAFGATKVAGVPLAEAGRR